MEKYNTISFDAKKFESEYEMMSVIADIELILVKQEYEVRFRYEDCDIYCLDYWHSESCHYGNDIPVWLPPERVFEERYKES